MKRLLTIALCLALPATASAQLFEDFEGGTFPPTGWTTTDNTTLGLQIWQTSSATTQGNFMGTVGETAGYDADGYDVLYNLDEHDSVLTTAVFPATSGTSLRFKLNFQDFGGNGDFDVEVTDGVSPFTSVANWTVDTPIGGSSTPQFIEAVVLIPDGTTQLQFRFSDTGTLWWFVQIDDLEWFPTPLQPGDCGFGFTTTWLEDFDTPTGVFPPAGWNVVDNLTNGQTWNLSSVAPYTGNAIGTTGDSAVVDSDAWGSGNSQDTELWTQLIDVPAGGGDLQMTMWWFDGFGGTAEIDASTDGGTTWTNLQILTGASFPTGTFTLNLDAYAGTTGLLVRFAFTGSYSWWWEIDDVKFGTDNPAPLASTAFRNDAGSTNLTILTDSGAPVMGFDYSLEVDVASSGLGFAQVFGYKGPLSLNLGGTSRIVLIDITHPGGESLAAPVLPGPTATYDYTIPNACSLVGFNLSIQAAVFNIPNNAPWALSNARDIVLGF